MTPTPAAMGPGAAGGFRETFNLKLGKLKDKLKGKGIKETKE